MRPREQMEKLVETIPGAFAKEKYILQGIAILCEVIEDSSTRIAAAILHNKDENNG